MNFNQYERNVVNCVKLSLELDNGIGNLNEFKSQFQNLLYLSQLPENSSEYSKNLLKLITKLYENHTQKTNNVQDKTKHVLIFFYRDKCIQSEKFFDEWKKIKTIIGDKTRFIAVNCEKYGEICEHFNVYQYPTIKYIKNNIIHDYLGNLNANEIISQYKL